MLILPFLIFSISIHTPAQGVTRTDRTVKVRNTISIHTPAQGVTVLIGKVENSVIISIHTPAQGVTGLQQPRTEEINDFNPHSRTGSDRHPKVTLGITHGISIHTPAQGVTGKWNGARMPFG